MKTSRKPNFIAVALLALAFITNTTRAADPLPSWNSGAAKNAVFAFVEKVTKPGSPDMAPGMEKKCRAGFIAKNVDRLSLRNIDITDQLGPFLC